MPGQYIVVASSEAWPESGAQAERALNTGWILDNGGGISSTGGVVSGAGPSTAVAFLSTGDGTTGSGNGFYALGRVVRVVHTGGTTIARVSAASLAGGQTTVTIDSVVSGPTALSTVAVTTVACAYPIGESLSQVPLYNYLVNPGFEIWQRGTGAYTAIAAFTADRWQIFDLGSTGTVSISRSATVPADSQYSATMASSSTGGAAVKLAQKIADEDSSLVQMLRGRRLTFTAEVSGTTGWHVGYKTSTGTGAWTSTGDSHSVSTGFEPLSVTFDLSTAATQLWVGVAVETATTGYIDNARLVIWPRPVRYTPKTPAQEWDECQRYYEVHGGVTNGAPRPELYASGAVSVGASISFATRKAVTPTMTKSGTWGVTNCGQPSAFAPTQMGYHLEVAASAAGMTNTLPNSTDDIVTAESNP